MPPAHFFGFHSTGDIRSTWTGDGQAVVCFDLHWSRDAVAYGVGEHASSSVNSGAVCLNPPSDDHDRRLPAWRNFTHPAGIALVVFAIRPP